MAEQTPEELEDGVDVRSGEYNYLQTRVAQDNNGAPDSPLATWIPARAGKFPERKGLRLKERTTLDQVTVHTRQSTKSAEAYARHYAANEDSVLAHYAVGPTTVQLVREKYFIYHGQTANDTGISIEHTGFAGHPKHYTEDLYKTSAKLVREICLRRSIPIDREHIKGHDEVGTNGDPGGYWDWDYYMALVNQRDPRRLVLADGDVANLDGGTWKVGSGWRKKKGPRSEGEKKSPYAFHSYGDNIYEADPLPDDGRDDDPAVFEVRIEEAGSYGLAGWWPVPLQGNNNNPEVLVRAYLGSFAPGGGKPPDGTRMIERSLSQKSLDDHTRETNALKRTPKWCDVWKLDVKQGDTLRVEVSRLSNAKGKITADAFRVLQL